MVLQYIFKYGVVAPIYTAFRWIIPILVVYGLPIFIAGMLVAILGTMGHIFFLLLFAIALLYYFKYVYNVFNPSSKIPVKPKKKQSVATKKFNKSLFNRNKGYRGSYNRYKMLSGKY